MDNAPDPAPFVNRVNPAQERFARRHLGRRATFSDIALTEPAWRRTVPADGMLESVKNNGIDRTLIRNVRDLDRAVNSRLRLLQKNPETNAFDPHHELPKCG
jgi:hypothetical protein